MNSKQKLSADRIIALSLSGARTNEKEIRAELDNLMAMSGKPFTNVDELRPMSVKELRETFLHLKYYISELGNQGQEIDDDMLFDTCVSVLQIMKAYANQLKGLEANLFNSPMKNG